MDNYTRQNSVFILTCPWRKTETRSAKTTRRKTIRKTTLLRLINQFWQTANIEPFIVSPDCKTGDYCNLFIQIKDCSDIYETLGFTRHCWEGNLMFVLGNFRYRKETIEQIVMSGGAGDIIAYSATINGTEEIVAIYVGALAHNAFNHFGITNARDEYPENHSLNSIFLCLKENQIELYDECKAILLLREAKATASNLQEA